MLTTNIRVKKEHSDGQMFVSLLRDEQELQIGIPGQLF
jgi:hypothetical protein